MGKGLFSEAFSPMEASSPDAQQHRCPAAMQSSMASSSPVAEPTSGERGMQLNAWQGNSFIDLGLVCPAHPRGAFSRRLDMGHPRRTVL